MRHRRVFAALAAAGILAVSGCSAASDNEKSAAAHDERAAAAPETGAGAGRAEAPGGAKTADPAATDPAGKPGAGGTESRKVPAAVSHLIRTAELQLEVADVGKAVEHARRVAETEGGYVSEESSGFEAGSDRGDTDSSRVVLRVPQERYGAVLAALSKGGRLLALESGTKDVTSQVVDAESRIASQRASVARVRELMERADKLSDIVSLEAELGRRQADLEALLAQQASLKNRSSLSTITLDYQERAPRAEKPAEKDDGPGVLDALSGGWRALVTVVLWIVVVLSAVLPFLVVLALGGALWWWLRGRALRARGGADPAPEPARDESGPAPAAGPDRG
ncbi:DUF4349 domain-containing protein [Streptomyces tsukubensis]|uniref:DUF4349 domain-containing protein n=1 Tax=Streptomyces tsukubensis TaxID=83656 RepID=UPI00344DEFF4